MKYVCLFIPQIAIDAGVVPNIISYLNHSESKLQVSICLAKSYEVYVNCNILL